MKRKLTVIAGFVMVILAACSNKPSNDGYDTPHQYFPGEEIGLVYLWTVDDSGPNEVLPHFLFILMMRIIMLIFMGRPTNSMKCHQLMSEVMYYAIQCQLNLELIILKMFQILPVGFIINKGEE